MLEVEISAVMYIVEDQPCICEQSAQDGEVGSIVVQVSFLLAGL